MKSKRYITVLSIAGSDSIGGAGIQADIKTISSLGCYAMTVVTAVTAQNTSGVKCFEAVSPKLLEAQLDAVLTDVIPDAVKIGMIPDSESIKIVADALKRYSCKNIVVDPVMVATSGDSLTSQQTVEILKEVLFPLATVVTPNLPETECLTGIDPKGELEIKQCGGKLLSRTEAVLIKGGHGDNESVIIDYLFMKNGGVYKFAHDRTDTINTHGTGCSLSSAIASFLARGESPEWAIEEAVTWIGRAIEVGASYAFGKGRGPINHNPDGMLYK